MPTPDPDLYQRAQEATVRLALRNLRALWARLDHSDPLAAREALEAYWPALLERYGEITATMAVDRFREITGLDGVMVRPVDPDRANDRMRWAMGPAFAGSSGESLARLSGLVDELVLQPGRSSLVASAAENGLSFARVPNAGACNWCQMLGSRGFVYESRASAGERRAFHNTCRCRIAVEGEETPDYDQEALLAKYVRARNHADSSSPEAVAAAMRELYGGH